MYVEIIIVSQKAEHDLKKIIALAFLLHRVVRCGGLFICEWDLVKETISITA